MLLCSEESKKLWNFFDSLRPQPARALHLFIRFSVYFSAFRISKYLYRIILVLELFSTVYLYLYWPASSPEWNISRLNSKVPPKKREPFRRGPIDVASRLESRVRCLPTDGSNIVFRRKSPFILAT